MRYSGSSEKWELWPYRDYVGQYAYKRPKDGVLVVPIGCLKD